MGTRTLLKAVLEEEQSALIDPERMANGIDYQEALRDTYGNAKPLLYCYSKKEAESTSDTTNKQVTQLASTSRRNLPQKSG